MIKNELLEELTKLQIEFVKYMESKNKIVKTQRDYDRLIMKNKTCCTYEKCIENLSEWILKYCDKGSDLILKAHDICYKIKNSDIKNLRFGLEPQRKFSSKESGLADYKIYLDLTLKYI